MSFSDAIGQIDQIAQWEQELTDPTAALSSTSSTSATTGGTDLDGTSSTTGTSFADQLAEAQADPGTAAADSATALTGTAAADSATALTGTAATDSAATDATTGASDLLSGGDSQLVTLLSGLLSSDSSSSTAAAETAASSVPVTSDSGPSGGEATSSSDPRIQAMTEEANALVGKPYVWGGGHDGWGPSSGYDCSGFVSAVLHAGGYLSSPQDTATLPTASGMEQGPGKYVTVYDRDEPGQEGHTIIDLNGQFYESGGEQGSWGGGGGVEQIATPSQSYLDTFNDVLHPAGL